MVETITIEKTKELIEDGANCVSFTLTQQNVNEWKENEYFKHIKNELEILPKLMFSCLKRDNGACRYYFVCDNEKIQERIVNMIAGLTEKRKIRLADCENFPCVGGNFDYRYEGEEIVCNLF